MEWGGLEKMKRGVVWCDFELMDDILGNQSVVSNAVRLE
jgi:hypothetical protein